MRLCLQLFITVFGRRRHTLLTIETLHYSALFVNDVNGLKQGFLDTRV